MKTIISRNKIVPDEKLNPQVRDEALARGLWERSEALLQKTGA